MNIAAQLTRFSVQRFIWGFHYNFTNYNFSKPLIFKNNIEFHPSGNLSLSLYIYIYMYIYTHIATTKTISLSLSIYIYINISISIYLSLSLYIYIYIHTCIHTNKLKVLFSETTSQIPARKVSLDLLGIGGALHVGVEASNQ